MVQSLPANARDIGDATLIPGSGRSPGGGNGRNGLETTDWFQIRKGVRQGCILSPCLFNLYAEYIMRNTGLEEAQAGRNINNLRYADDRK